MELVSDPTNVRCNSYCDLDFANSYHEVRSFNDEWVSASDEDKSKVLMWSTLVLDSLAWLGDLDPRNMPPEVVTALRWPRNGVYDRDGRLLSNELVPVDIKRATAELALFLLREDRTEGYPLMDQDSIKIGSISITNTSYNKFPQSVISLIRPYAGSQSQFQPRVERV